MNFNEHWGLEGQHAFLSPSTYHWINDSPEKLANRYSTWQARQRGTRLHALAQELITLGVKLPRNNQTLSMYVNDAIGYRMSPEQVLYFSDNCFGTADAIGFRRNKLRIHDLKTGTTPASMHQLELYQSIFCLEYDMDPREFDSELRIYQNNEIVVSNPDPEYILDLMDKIQEFDTIIDSLKEDS